MVITEDRKENPVNISISLSSDTLITSKTDLKDVVKEVLIDIQSEREIDDVLKVSEAAKILKVSLPKMRELIDSNDIPCFRNGQVIRLRKIDILTALGKGGGVNEKFLK